MKSDNKWSDKDVDELLTSFFQAEVPARLDSAMPITLRQAASGPQRPKTAVSSSSRQWITAAMMACAAALVVAVAAFQFGGGAGSSSTVVEQPPETETINVNGGTTDDSDFAVPEQNIEILD